MSVHGKDMGRITARRRLPAVLLFPAVGILLFFCSGVFEKPPFPFRQQLVAPVNVFSGRTGRLYVIDEGKKEILILDEDGKYAGSIRGGRTDRDFFYASLVCDDDEGNIYVADVVYAGEGTKVKSERVLRFDSRGKRRKALYEITYEPADMPFQYGKILQLKWDGKALSFVHSNKEGVACIRLTEEGQLMEQSLWPFDGDIHSAAFDEARNRMTVSTMQGEIWSVSPDGALEKRNTGNRERLPWAVSMDGGELVYADLLSNSIIRQDGTEETCIFRGDNPLYTVSPAPDGSIYTTDYSSVIRLKDGRAEYLTDYEFRHPVLRTAVWAVGAGFVTLIVFLALKTLLYAIGKGKDKNKTILIGMVLGACLCIAVTVSALAIQFMLEKQETNTMRDLNQFADMLMKKVNVGKTADIRSLKDYGSKTFREVKDALDEVTRISYKNGLYYYYVLYGAKDESLFGIMDYENTLAVGQPVYEWGDNVYTHAVTKKEKAQVYGDVSAYGTWSFVLRPVLDRRGRIAAVLETGINMDEYEASKKDLILEICLTLAVSVVVVIMLLLEVIFLLSDRLNKRGRKAGITEYMPLRSMIFLLYAADSLQDTFIVQLCYRLWKPGFFIGRETAAGLPVSAELFMAALFSLAGGRLVGRLGARKNMMSGLILQTAGFLICALSGSYWAIFAGKVLMGAGMGLVSVTASSLAAYGETQEESGRAFAGINAGILGGITVGDGLSSILLTFGGYRFIFAAGAGAACLNFALAFHGMDFRPEAEKREGKTGGTLRFFADRRVQSFFLLLLIPFMIMIYYREYFFPLYAQEHGVSEITVGRLFLVCGLLIIYAGPFLCKKLLEKLGGFRAMVSASLLLLFDLALFMLFPGFPAAVAGVLLLSVVISFAYSCQNAYFVSLPACAAYGEGKAMGIYAMMDNAGQTLGPVVFGTALRLGFTAGIRLLGGSFGITLIFFLIINARRGRADGSKNKWMS